MQALQLRCESFMCNNFHKILNDPLLQVRHCLYDTHCWLLGSIDPQPLVLTQDLTRYSLLSMLRAQSAMLGVYKQHMGTQTWGLTR